MKQRLEFNGWLNTHFELQRLLEQHRLGLSSPVTVWLGFTNGSSTSGRLVFEKFNGQSITVATQTGELTLSRYTITDMIHDCGRGASMQFVPDNQELVPG